MDGLARVLSKQDFDAESFVKKQTANNSDSLIDLREQVGTLRDETSVALKKNVYKNYSQFIETAKEISILEGEMYQLSHLLTEQKNNMVNLSELSLTGRKESRDNEEVKEVDALGAKIGISFLLEKVEGCTSIADVPGRGLIHDGDVIELDPDSLRQKQKVHLFLLSDSLLVTLCMPEWKGTIKYKYQTLFELDSLAVVNIRDEDKMMNAFRILMFPDSRIFAVSSPKAKRQWLDLLDQTKKDKLNMEKRKRKMEEEMANMPLPPPRRSSTKNDKNAPVKPSSLVPSSQESDFLKKEWVRELPEDLDVAIAQRDFEGAVDLVIKITEYLEKCPKHVSASDYKSRIDHRVKQLTEVLTHELKLSPERSIRGGPRGVRRAVAQLIRLGKSIQACELFLKNRSAISRYSLKRLKTESNTLLYVGELCKTFFSGLVDVSREFIKAFPNHPGCYSAFIAWCKEELQFFVDLFTSQVFGTKSNFSTVAKCVSEARRCCGTLNEAGLDLVFVLDRLLGSPLLTIVQQAGDTQMDAVRHRASDDQWRPSNFQSIENLQKFEEDMKSYGFININQYSFNACFSFLTSNTYHFSKSYVTFCCDLLNLYSTDTRWAIVEGLKDILMAQTQHLVKAAEAKEFEASLPLIRRNAEFLSNSLLKIIQQKHLNATGFHLTELDGLKEKLKKI